MLPSRFAVVPLGELGPYDHPEPGGVQLTAVVSCADVEDVDDKAVGEPAFDTRCTAGADRF